MSDTMTLKSTALSEKHIALGAKMVPFAGYNMPVSYTGLNEEHAVVRNSVGVFDVSHMGEFILKGEKALDLIQYVTSNDAAQLYDGRVQYSCLPNGKGGIVDDLLVYRMDDKTYMLVVNASNIEKDWNWISKHNTYGVEMKDISDRTSLLAVQGPKAMEALQKLTDIKLADMPYYHFVKGKFAGEDNIVISNTGYTGSGGFEIYFDNAVAEKMWDAIFKAGEEFGIKPIGLGARDTLRLEMGFCLYGNDIDDSTSPIEAGLGWVTKFNKDFIDKAYLQEQKEKGVTRKLIAFEMIDRGIPRHHYEIADASGNVIGTVTSGTQAPSLQKGIGMGYVKTEFAKTDNEIFIKVRDKALKAKIVKLPFYKK
ncbi:glycine cleavage system aminomethyltransferase GcvT [soil metagenome]